MRILFFYGWSVHKCGGAELSVLSLAEGMAHAGHSVGVADIPGWGGWTQKSLGPQKIPYWGIRRASMPKGLRSTVSFARGTWQTLALLREFKPDILSVQSPVFQSGPVAAACRLPHQWRLAVTVRGSDVREMPSKFPLLGPWQNRLLKRADAVIAVSRSLLQDVLHRCPAARDRAQVIPNGLDSSWFDNPVPPPAHGERYVLFVGRFHNVKGVDILLRAWSMLRQQASGINLWLVGEGNELRSLKSLADVLGVGESVRFKGHRTQAELPSVYRGAEMVVLPSRNEGLPRVALEAGACGAICVAARAGGIPETLLDGVTGFLVDRESPEALASGMLRALRLPGPEKRRMSAEAREHIREHFRQETMVVRYEQVFQSMLHNAREKAPVGAPCG